MPIRITGMNSGLDTESIISELVKAKSAKKDSLVKAQTKLQWKQDAWKELNTKVYNLYSKTLSNMRLQSDYLKKTTKVSNSNAASVITGANAVIGVQTLKIDKLAKSGYLTGAEVSTTNGNDVKNDTTLSELGITSDTSISLTNGDGTTKTIDLTADMKISDVVSKLKNEGLNASFDENNQRLFVSAKESGLKNDFTLSGTGMALTALGLSEKNVQKDFKKKKSSKPYFF